MAVRWNMNQAFFLSITIHMLLVAASTFLFQSPPITVHPVIKVSIVTDAAPAANRDFQYGKIIDMPESKNRHRKEKPDSTQALSTFDSPAQAKSGGKGLSLPAGSPPKEATIRDAARETQKHKQSSDMPKSTGEARTVTKENRLSEVELAAAQHEKGGEVSPLQPDKLTRSERETRKEQRPLRGDEIDGFAASSPSGVLETESEIVIPLNTRRFEYMAYFATLRKAVENAWSYPSDAMENGIGGKAVIRFTIGRQGSLEEAKVISSAGAGSLDNAALEAIQRSAPFKAFPDNLDKEKIHIVATFNYAPQYGKVP